jgi:hypothetical protein
MWQTMHSVKDIMQSVIPACPESFRASALRLQPSLTVCACGGDAGCQGAGVI